MKTNGLPTSGLRWGISCEVPSEAMMGVVLGYLTVIGAANVAWGIIKQKDPARVEQGRQAAAAKAAKKVKKSKKGAGARPSGRKPLDVVTTDFIDRAAVEFDTPQFRAHLVRHGWKSVLVMQDALRDLLKRKIIKRISRGKYRKLTHIKAVEAA